MNQFAPQPLFLGKITGGVFPNYTFSEVWMPTGSTTLAVKVGGRYGDSNSPGVSVTGATFAADDIVLVRAADGSGGRRWEVFPGGSGGGSGGCVEFRSSRLSANVTIPSSGYVTVAEVTPDDFGAVYWATFMANVIVNSPSSGTVIGVGILDGLGLLLTVDSYYTVPVTGQELRACISGCGIVQNLTAPIRLVVWVVSGSLTSGTVLGHSAFNTTPPDRGISSAQATVLSCMELCVGNSSHTFYTPETATPPPPSPPISPPTPSGKASISGHVNGDWPNYAAVSGRTVTLFGGNNATTTTDGDGYYVFGDLNVSNTFVILDTDYPSEIASYSIDDGEWASGSEAFVYVTADTDHTVNFRTAQANTLTLSGTVTDVAGPTAYPGRVITAVQGGVTSTATTDGSGGYTFGSLYPAFVVVQISDLSGLESAEYNLDSAGWVSGVATVNLSADADLDWRIDGSVVSPPVPPPPP